MRQKTKKSESFQNLEPDAKGGHFFVTLFWEIFYDTFYGQNLEPDAKVGHVHLIPLHFGSCSMFSSTYFRISYNIILFLLLNIVTIMITMIMIMIIVMVTTYKAALKVSIAFGLLDL